MVPTWNRTGASETGYFTWWNFPKKAWLIIIAEMCVITSLSVWFYATYLNDIYFQSYVNGLAPLLVPVLIVAFGVCSASIATYLYLGMKRFHVINRTVIPTKKKFTPKKIDRHPSSQTVPTANSSESSAAGPPAKLRPLSPIHKHAQRSLKDSQESDSSRQNKRDIPEERGDKNHEQS